MMFSEHCSRTTLTSLRISKTRGEWHSSTIPQELMLRMRRMEMRTTTASMRSRASSIAQMILMKAVLALYRRLYKLTRGSFCSLRHII